MFKVGDLLVVRKNVFPTARKKGSVGYILKFTTTNGSYYGRKWCVL